MPADALGFLGRAVVAKFNEIGGGEVATRLILGHTSINDAANGLDVCAKKYEETDADWYRQ